jgi:hypothetical protein
MNSTSFRPEAFWPSGTWLPLLKAAYHSDLNSAVEAWNEWRSVQDFDSAPWNQIMVAATARKRLPATSLGGLARRLAGVRRFIWTQGSLRLLDAAPFLKTLSAADIPFLMLKGGARIARDPDVLAERSFADLDVLIRPKDWARVTAIVFDRDYPNVWGLDRTDVEYRLRNTHHSLGIKVAAQMEIDLHQSSLLLNRQRGADDNLWARAVSSSLAGVPILLPRSPDLLAIVFGHAFLHIDQPNYHWVGDALACIRADDFDWREFENIVEARKLTLPALTALRFLDEELQAGIPPSTLQKLRAAVAEPFVTEFKAFNAPAPIDDPVLQQSILSAELRRAEKLAALAAGTRRAPRDRRKRSAENTSINNFIIAVPPGADFDRATLELTIEFPRLREPVKLSLRTFDYFHIELGRAEISKASLLYFGRKRKRRTISIRVQGLFLRAREIPLLRVVVWPASNARPSQNDADLEFSVKYRWLA